MHLKIEIRGNSLGDLIDGIKEAVRKTKVEIVMSVGDNTGNQEYIKPLRKGYPGIEYDMLIEIGNRKKQG
jgi:hypothetical protein